MDLLQEIDDYIKETINESLGLPVSARTLQLKLRVYEDAYFRLRDQHLHLIGKFRQKDILIDRAKAEANMNAAAIKKFVEENQRLAAECANLVSQCNKWERECSLYDNDREALMEFGNEADERAREAEERAKEAEERAKEAEIRVRELEEESGKAVEELQFYKHKCHASRLTELCEFSSGYLHSCKILPFNSVAFDSSKGINFTYWIVAQRNVHFVDTEMNGLLTRKYCLDDSSAESIDMEENSLESILATLVGKDEVESGQAYLEVNSGYESCQNLLKMWNSLRPSTRKVLSLAAKAKTLQQDKEHLRINLTRAEEEVKLLFEENSILDVENKRLLRREQNFDGSGGKHTSSASAKRSKRKSSSRSSPVESKIDSENIDSLRQPLSPLRHNSPGCRLYK
ncbi:hypothetical protein DKX38_002523 [Salix brachista]|uniref:Uncharacterized protein n=1 Tax=Salix brachista TaxID=2182728 RepID=A0A5N5NMC0_9ROSI|nr:hypothetical protein DKX38_002523 [Salix brachista]